MLGPGGVALLLVGLVAVAAACGDEGGAPAAAPADPEAERRAAMVREQIVSRGITDVRVLDALRRVPRHRFVPSDQAAHAHTDGPLAIGSGQTVSQPYIVALMTELIRPHPGQKVLEIGTGSGYQAAVLAACGCRVFSIEILPELGRAAAALLRELGYDGVSVRIGDGFDGWPEEAPFDAILVTAAPDEIPRPLLDQLAVGGRLVIPVGRGSQSLVRVTRTPEGWRREEVLPVRFVPMTGKARERASDPP